MRSGEAQGLIIKQEASLREPVFELTRPENGDGGEEFSLSRAKESRVRQGVGRCKHSHLAGISSSQEDEGVGGMINKEFYFSHTHFDMPLRSKSRNLDV